MSISWPLVPLGEAITYRKEFIRISEFDNYKRCRVQLHGKGIVLRDIVSGAEIKTKEQQVCRAGEFLVAEIDAKVGGFGVVPDELDGSIVSSHYFLFELNIQKLNGRFLDYFVRTPFFRDQVSARGSTNYAAIRPHHVLHYQIVLPPLPQQLRIMARIEELAAKIKEACTLRQQAAEEADTLVANEIKARFEKGRNSGWATGTLGDYVIDCCYGTSDKTNDDDSGTPVLRMGNIQNGRLDLHDLKYLHVAEKDRAKFVLTNSAELVGKCAVFDVEGEFAFASYLIRLRLDTKRADPRLVASFINSPAGRAYMFRERKQMTGQANVNAIKLKALPIALPPLSDQRRIVADLDSLQARIGALKKLQAETAAELGALLPSILDKAFKGNL
ncbi:MAG: hypothetical protein DME76_10910 [Verrucomicrobia bacterium]|nr:MAG: hypothetical protein DME76_10910 [Verrucomicrobiota bacterium]